MAITKKEVILITGANGHLAKTVSQLLCIDYELRYLTTKRELTNNFSIIDYYSNVDAPLWVNWGFGGILSTINERKQFLLSHQEISLIPPTINNVIINNNLVTVEVFNANTVEIMATISEYNSKFKSFIMLDDGTNGDIIANDGTYTSILPFNSSGLELKFYIRAENNDAIKLSPQRAEFEFYVHSQANNIVNFNSDSSRKLICIKDALGRKVKESYGIPLFYIYNNGTVEKKIILR